MQVAHADHYFELNGLEAHETQCTQINKTFAKQFYRSVSSSIARPICLMPYAGENGIVPKAC